MTALGDPAASLADLVNHARGHGIAATARALCAGQATLPARRQTALFVVGLWGHRIGVERLLEQPYGYVGECERCAMVIKVPRTLEAGEPGVQGRASEVPCPSGFHRGAREPE